MTQFEKIHQYLDEQFDKILLNLGMEIVNLDHRNSLRLVAPPKENMTYIKKDTKSIYTKINEEEQKSYSEQYSIINAWGKWPHFEYVCYESPEIAASYLLGIFVALITKMDQTKKWKIYFREFPTVQKIQSFDSKEIKYESYCKFTIVENDQN